MQGVPDGTSKSQLAAKLKANGQNVPDAWLAPAKPAAPKFTGKPSDWLQAGEGAMRLFQEPQKLLGAALGGTAAAGPVSDVAGLADIPLHAAGITKTMPQDVKANVQKGIASANQPISPIGSTLEKYNPMSVIGRLVESLAKKGESAVAPPATSGPGRAALGYLTRGAIEQAPNIAGAMIGKRAAGRFAGATGCA